MEQPARQNFIIGRLRDLLCGILIGGGAILPGVSGGILAVVFGIYEPFMELLTKPKTALPKYWIRFAVIALGWCVGFLGIAKGIAAAFTLSDTVTTWLFIGLIAGTGPSLFREAGKKGRSAEAWGSFLLCAVLVFAGLYYISHVAEISVRPNFWWYNFCGMLWGASVVIPGMTSSSVMMALGLYQPMLDGLARLDLLVLSACLPGMVLTVLLLARAVNWLFRKKYALAFHGILGIVTASTLAIIPVHYEAGEGVLSAACCAAGFLLALLLARLDRKMKE